MGNKSGHSGFNASQAGKAKMMGIKAGAGAAPMAPNRAQGQAPAAAMAPAPAMPKGKMPC